MSLLISLEGVDNNSKNNLINSLKESSELNLVLCSWRSTKLGKKISNLLSEIHREKVWSHLFFILTAFEELAEEKIRPSLQEKKIVVIDSYIDNILVYQGLEGGIGINVIQKVIKKTIDLELPDITFVLDIDPQQIQKKTSIKWDNLKLEFYQRIRNHYLKLKEIFPERIYILNVEQGEKKMMEEVQSIIKGCLPNSGKKDLPSFVRVVIRNEIGEFLLVKDKWGWNFPGGKIEKGETPESAAKREVFEETNLIVENLEKITEGKIFYANLPKGNQYWKGYFFQANKYSGELKIKELGKIFDIRFMDYNSPENTEKQQPYRFYWEKVKKLKNYAQ